MKKRLPMRTQAATQPSHATMRLLIFSSKLCLVLAGVGFPLQGAWANPAGENVTAGSVAIQRIEELTQIRASDGAIIEWHGGFDIAAHETVEFIQPDLLSHVLNKDMTSSASIIDGTLLANGKVTIANPFGIWFGSQAVVDVAHLTAAAGTVSNEDFLSDRLHLTETGGDVINAGSIRAQRVALIGRQVANFGHIVSPDGQIFMLAGEDVIIGEWGSPVRVSFSSSRGDDFAVENDGIIDAGRGRVRMAAGDALGLAVRSRGVIRGGEIVLDGASGSVAVSGSLDTSNRGDENSGGRIEIGGDQIVLRGATLDASGETGGGEILVGGRAHGETRNLGNATETSADTESILRADAGAQGDGGRVVVWADDRTSFYGEISARGGAQGGDGGFIETSGRIGLDVAGARVDASAPAGQGGNWLLDPRDVQIVSSESFAVDSAGADPAVYIPNDAEPESAPARINAETLSAALNTGTNVTIQTTGSTVENQDGTISVLSAINTAIPEGQTTTLTLAADMDIIFEEDITDSGNGALNVTLDAYRNIKFDSVITIPDGVATLTAGKDNDTGSIAIITQTFEPKITAQSASLTAVDFIATVVTNSLGTPTGEVGPFNIATPVLSATASAGSVWVQQTGDQNLTVEAASSDGETGGFVSIENSGGSLTVTGPITTGGGAVELATTESGGSIVVTRDGRIDTRKTTVEAATDIGGNVGFDSVGGLEILGGIFTGGGSILGTNGATAAVAQDDIQIDGNGEIDTRLSDPGDPTAGPWAAGTISLQSTGDIRVAANLSAANIDLYATDASDGTVCANSAVCFAANSNSGDLPILRAYSNAEIDPSFSSNIVFQAGNPAAEAPRTVDAQNAIFTGGEDGTNPSQFTVFQTADLVDETLPDATAFGAGDVDGLSYTVVAVRAGTTESSPNSGLITLDTTSKFDDSDLTLRAGESVQLEFLDTDPVSFGSLSVQVDGNLEIDAGFAPADTLSAETLSLYAGQNLVVNAPSLSASTSLELVADYLNFNSTSGDLSIGPDVTLDSPTVTLWGGQSGTGSTAFSENVTLVSDNIRILAGNGASLDAAVTLQVDNVGQTRFTQAPTGTDRSFEIVQDAPLLTSSLPAASAFTEGLNEVNYSLESVRGSITLDPAAEGLTDIQKVTGTNLSLIAGDGVSITTTNPIEVNSATVGGRGAFTVTQELADQIRFVEKADGTPADAELTFRSGTVSNSGSNLTFQLPEADGILSLHADTLTFHAGGSAAGVDYEFSNPSAIEFPEGAAGRLAFLNQYGDAGSAPDTFVFQQDAPITADHLPRTSYFGNNLGPATLFEIHSPYNYVFDSFPSTTYSVNLGEPGSVPGVAGSKLLAKGPWVHFGVSDLNLDLGTRPLEIHAAVVSLLAEGEIPSLTDGGPGTPARVLSQDLGAASLGGYDVPDTAPGILQIQQTETILGSELPLFTAWQGGAGPDGVAYSLKSLSGGINLAGEGGRVAGSQLRLEIATPGQAIDFGGGTLEVETLLATNAGELHVIGDPVAGTTLQAEDSIILASACQPTPGGDCTGQDLSGNLRLEGNLTLDAPDVALDAGSIYLQLAEGETLPVVTIAPSVAFDLQPTDPEDQSLFTVIQSAELTNDNLPQSTQFVGTLLSDIDQYTAISLKENVTITEIDQVRAQQLFLTAADTVHIQQEEGGLLRGDLANSLLTGEAILLEATGLPTTGAPNGGYVEADADSLEFALLSPASSFEIRQRSSFEINADDSGELPLRSQFLTYPTAANPITYTVASTGGDVIVDNASFGASAADTRLVLQSGDSSGGTTVVRFEDNIDASANLYSLAVNTNIISYPNAAIVFAAPDVGVDQLGTLEIATRFDQTYGAPVQLESNAHLTASSPGLSGDILFSDTLSSNVSGASPAPSLTTVVDHSVRFASDVGRSDSRLASLQIEAGQQTNASPVAIFGDLVESDDPASVAVYTEQDIELFYATGEGDSEIVNPRTAIPASATIYMQETDSSSTRFNPDLYFDSASGSVLMGANEKLSVPGVLRVNASTEARVGDLSALELYVTAPAITLVRRGQGPVLHSDGSVGTDGGVDYVANTIDFDGEITLGGSGRQPAFGVPNPFLAPLFVNQNGFPVAATNIDNAPLTESEFYRGTDPGILDLQPLGASQADLAEAFWIPPSFPLMHAPPQQLAVNPAALIEIGVAMLPTTAAEYQSRLRGAGLFDDVDSGVRLASAPAWVSEARILPKDARLALAAYRRVLGPQRENAGKIREILQAALDDYRSLTGARRVVGFEFRRYLKNRPSSQLEAYVTLEDLDALFLHQRRSGLVAAEFQHVQNAWLEEITPDGITSEELSQAIFPSRYVRGSEILDVYGE